MLHRVLLFALCTISSIYGTEALPSRESPAEDAAAHLARRQQSNNDAKPVMDRLHAQYTQNTRAGLPPNGGACTSENIAVRKEWGNMSPSERSSFISAVHCLNTSPRKSPREMSQDAKNRWDDFTIAHNINTPNIHWSGLMLPWHRHFLWEMEQALRNECGYSGYLPYWDYAKHLGRPIDQNPLFDGTETSIGGDGTGVNGCVEDGPFANFTVNMPPPDESARQQRNPYCIKRQFTPGVLETYSNYEKLTQLLQNSADIVAFHSQLEQDGGIHAMAHEYIGGLQDTIWLASQDPVFFHHHAMIDRMWTMWQSGDFDRRRLALDPSTWFEDRDRLSLGPLPEATLDTTIYISPIFENVTVRDAMSPTSGRYCYIYD